MLPAVMLALVAPPVIAQGRDATDFADRLVTAVPKLALLKANDPVAFGKVIDIYKEGTRAGKPQDELIGLARQAFMESHVARVVRAPDALMLQAFDSTLGVIRDLQMRDAGRCAALLSGGNAGDIKPLLSPATIGSEDAVFDAMLTYKAQAFTPAAGAAEEGAFIAEAVAAEAASAGEQPRAFLIRMYGAPDTYCALQRAFMERMRRAPNAVALFRRRRSVGQRE